MENRFTKEEFNMLVMLYAAAIDGKTDRDEIEAILGKTDTATYARVKKRFDKMSDMEILDSITEYKSRCLPTPEDRRKALDDMRDILKADKRLTAMECHLARVMDNLLEH